MTALRVTATSLLPAQVVPVPGSYSPDDIAFMATVNTLLTQVLEKYNAYDVSRPPGPVPLIQAM